MNIDRKVAFGNFLWKFAEQFGSVSVSFIVSIILARLLAPEDYSTVSIIMILTAFCAVFIDGGLSKALVQKKEVDNLDYSTVFTFSLCIAFIAYGVLFFLAPFIAKIYDNDLLVSIIRVYSIIVFIGAFCTIQNAFVAKNLMFRKYFLATILGTMVSAIIGVFMAYKGFGSWALVAQQMTNSITNAICLFLTTGFRVQFRFSLSRLKALWSFGGKVLGTSLLDMLYDNVRPLIVGLKFKPVDLAFYEKGKSYPGLLNNMLNSSLSSVLFPVMASFQENLKKVKTVTQTYVRVSSFIIFPTLLGLAAVANNLIPWMLTEKWCEAVPYMQVFCINYMFMLLQTGNLQALNAIGRSDIVLKLAIIKKCINFVLLFIVTLTSTSPIWLAALGIITSFIAFIINAFANKKVLNYGLTEQIKDIVPNLINSVIMAVVVLKIGQLFTSLFVSIIVQIATGVAVYTLLAYITCNYSFTYCASTLQSLVKAK